MSEGKSFFQCFQADNPVALARRVEELDDELKAARAISDQLAELDLMSRLGTNLIILGREAEAAPLLEQALALARKQDNQRLEVANLLQLTTARQYLGQVDLAQQLFQEALQKARDYNQRFYEDFILHHQGRCFVEQGKKAAARACFEQALQSKQSALDALQDIDD